MAELSSAALLSFSRRLKNVAQFCNISSLICQVSSKGILADIFRSGAVLTQGSELRVNNAGTQRKKEISEGVRRSADA